MVVLTNVTPKNVIEKFSSIPLNSSEKYFKAEQIRFNDQLDTVGRREGTVLGYHISNLSRWVNGGINY